MTIRKPAGDPAGDAVRRYIAALPPASRRRLQHMRAVVRATAPGAADHFSYRMPAFKLEGQILVWYAAFAAHTSLFPITPALLRAHRIDVAGYKTSKGTIQFPLAHPLPVALVKRIVKARIAEVRKRNKAR
jgi:uncharacterized protein YdhG (YjbR/CyaY superfamily)